MVSRFRDTNNRFQKVRSFLKFVNKILDNNFDCKLVIHLRGSNFVETVQKARICKNYILCMFSYYFDA